MDHTQFLPIDSIADILSRLPPRDLAVSRCVRKAWHDVIDARRLLLRHVLPRTRCAASSSATSTTIARASSPVPQRSPLSTVISTSCLSTAMDLVRSWITATASCYIVPAPRSAWSILPRGGGIISIYCEQGNSDEHLVFDPLASPHYEVFSIPQVPKKVLLSSPSPDTSRNLEQLSGPYGLTKLFSLPNDGSTVEDTEDDFEDGSAESSPEQSKKEGDFPTSSASPPTERRGEQVGKQNLMELPPSVWTLNVFSSRTRRWQNRSFVREGEAAVTRSVGAHMYVVGGTEVSLQCVLARIALCALPWCVCCQVLFVRLQVPSNKSASRY